MFKFLGRIVMVHSAHLVAPGPAGRARRAPAEVDFLAATEPLTAVGDGAAAQALHHRLALRIEEEVERRVLKRYAELKASNGALESFTCSVAHDLRAPLRSIDFFSALLAEKAVELDEESALALSRIRSAHQRMNAMISDLLEFSRVSSTELCKMPIDVSAMAREIMHELRVSAPDRRVEWRIEPGIVAYGDPGLLQLVLDNLLGNAFKYSRQAEIARIELGCAHLADGSQELRVSDNGAGFDMQFSSKLFVAFQRLHRADEFEGTGIGLATVRRIVERHGGRVGATGETGKGSTFTFTLPGLELETEATAFLTQFQHGEEGWRRLLSMLLKSAKVILGTCRSCAQRLLASDVPTPVAMRGRGVRPERLLRELGLFAVSGAVLFGVGVFAIIVAAVLV
jgi:signal transduction histidine kinase